MIGRDLLKGHWSVIAKGLMKVNLKGIETVNRSDSLKGNHSVRITPHPTSSMRTFGPPMTTMASSRPFRAMMTKKSRRLYTPHRE